MRITDRMLVPEGVRDGDADLFLCHPCGTRTWHVPQKVMVFSASGARSMRLWACEKHPLPDTVTDNPEETET